MMGDYFDIESEKVSKAIFANDKNSPEVIIQRKKQWLKNYIKQNNKDIKNIKMIFEIIVTFFESDKLEFIMELLQTTKDIEIFKSISFFPNEESWTGSEVPIIDEKIKFLDCLLDTISGVDYIEHKEYIRELKDSYRDYKQIILLREYTESGSVS